MLSIPPGAKVFLAIGNVDFRKQIPGLKKWIQNHLLLNPLSGAYFFFFSKDRISIKMGFAPRKTKAFTVETKVKEGTITSSPGLISNSIAAISSA